MDQQVEQPSQNKHLNLFYTYRTNHIEDNVTRALLITLSRLTPVHLRLFIRDLVLKNKIDISQRLQFFAEPDFTFEPQVSEPLDETRRLDVNNGVIVGINLSGTQALTFGTLDKTGLGGARIDALVADNGNDITLIFESKLRDDLYCEQIERHFKTFFDQRLTSLKEVFVEITWSDIATYLQGVQRQTGNTEEKFTISEFVQYLDWLGLVDFLGFQASDFPDRNYRKLNRFVAFVCQSRSEELGLESYGNDYKVFFKDIPDDNIWCDIDDSSMRCGIVCGSGKKWRAETLRDKLLQKSDEFYSVLEELQTQLDPKMRIVLRIHSNFHHSRFRTAWLGEIGGAQLFPDGYQNFVRNFTDPLLNSFKKLSKQTINEVFGREVEENMKRGSIQLDNQARFPKWEDLDSFLQYCYFHIDVEIPAKMLIGKPVKDITDKLVATLKPLHKTLLKLKV
jgi:hypothetical protein